MSDDKKKFFFDTLSPFLKDNNCGISWNSLKNEKKTGNNFIK